MESWKDVKGYEGFYQVSNKGQVKSLERLTEAKPGVLRKVSKRILKPGINSSGYYSVVLCRNGKRKSVTVHRIVAEAFIPKKAKKKDINHIDGNKRNNDSFNLEWCTESENSRHARDNNLTKNSTKLTKEQAEEIKGIYRSGNFTQKEIANKYNTIQQNVSLIVNNKRWN